MSGAEEMEKAALSFVCAVLRREEGEPITAEEWATFRTLYLPQDQDDARVLDLKRWARLQAVFALEAGMPSPFIISQMKTFWRIADERQSKAEAA